MEGRGPVESMKDTVVERSSRLLVDCGLSVRTPGKENRGVALMPVNTPQKLGTGTPNHTIHIRIRQQTIALVLLYRDDIHP